MKFDDIFILTLIKHLTVNKAKREEIKKEILFLQKTKSVEVLSCQVGKCTYCGNNVRVYDNRTKIGKFCSLAGDIDIGLSAHPTHYLSTSPFLYVDLLGYSNNDCREIYSEPVSIGNDVWIGENVSILMGVKIGDGAIIGAHALVTKDVPPYSIVVGVPAKILRYRFEKDIIDDLLKLKWWDLDDKYIKEIPFKDVNMSIEYLKKIRGDTND